MAQEQKKPSDLASLWGAQPGEGSLKKPEGEAVQGEIIKKVPLPPEPADEPQESPPEAKPKVGVKMSHTGDGEEALEPIEAEVMEGEKGLGEKVDELLSELNVSRKHIYIGVGGLILLVFGIVFGIKFAGSFLRKKVERVEVIVEKPNGDKAEAPKSKEKLDSSIRASLAFSQAVLFPPYFYPQGGVELAFSLGQPMLEKKDLVRVSLFVLKRMQNAFSTDINGLLQKAINRRGVLENHITLLRHLVDEASTTLAQLDTELNRLKPEFEEALKNQEAIEKQFFEEVGKLNIGAGRELELFVEEAKRMISARANLRALQTIYQRLNRAIPRMQARIHDIELNKEAIISGVKIYDVRGSDLELIVPAEVSEAKGAESSQPGASKLLGPSRYTSPFELPAQDFIKTPGGGMAR